MEKWKKSEGSEKTHVVTKGHAEERHVFEKEEQKKEPKGKTMGGRENPGVLRLKKNRDTRRQVSRK